MLTFNDWFSANYDKLREKFSLSFWFIPDVFHDAYLCALENSMTAFRNCSDSEKEKIYFTLFNAAYKAQNKMYYSGKVREMHPTNFVWSILASNLLEDDDASENASDKSMLIQRIKQFARRTFDKEQYAIFEAYFVHSFGYENTGAFCGKSTTYAFKHVAIIRDMICRQFEDEILNLK